MIKRIEANPLRWRKVSAGQLTGSWWQSLTLIPKIIFTFPLMFLWGRVGCAVYLIFNIFRGWQDNSARLSLKVVACTDLQHWQLSICRWDERIPIVLTWRLWQLLVIWFVRKTLSRVSHLIFCHPVFIVWNPTSTAQTVFFAIVAIEVVRSGDDRLTREQ